MAKDGGKFIDRGASFEKYNISLAQEIVRNNSDIIMIKELMKRHKIKEYRVYEPSKEEQYFLPQTDRTAASIVVVFLPYFTKNHDFEGNLSVYTQGEDYHIWVKRLLEEIARELKSNYSEEEFGVQVDIGPICEKEIAYQSGLGMRGIHSLIIHERYGTYGFLGLILSTMKLERFMTPQKDCIRCMECMRHCPGQAIRGDFTIDVRRCASSISQKKEDLTEEEEAILRRAGKVFGCDICQRVCPHNRQVEMVSERDLLMRSLEEEDLKDLSGKAFMRNYGNRSFSWRGKKIIERNMKVFQKREE